MVTPLDHAAIARLIPHHGNMCLLETVISWDEQHLCAQATSHVSAHNPLRNAHGLPATAGIEYAAQAMAVHGALRSDAQGKPVQGRLVAIRQVVCTQAWLHDIAAPLTLVVKHLMSDDRTMMYQFTVSAADQDLVTGRATVNLQSESSP